MLDILHQKPFERISVKDFLWGYESPLVRLGNDILPPEEKLPFNKFGIFTGVRNCLPAIFFRVRAALPDVNCAGNEIFRLSPIQGSWFQKNGTAEGILKVVTGLREVAHVGQILSFNGKVKLDFWKGRCNDLKWVLVN